MAEPLDLWEIPEAEEIFMLVGWRQWADAGSTSSGLPEYLIKHLNASQTGKLDPNGYYLFQIPGTHDLVRPVVKYDEGLPVALQTPRNEFFYAGDEARGWLIFLGDEPHMNVEGYVAAILEAASRFKVRRIIGFGGVYGELPYEKERIISASYSLAQMKAEMEDLAVNLTEYHGGAAIGSILCRRAGERDQEYVSLYAFVPAYEFTGENNMRNSIQIENDYMAWLGIMKRVNHMLKTGLDLTDLEQKSEKLLAAIDAKVDEIEKDAPQLGVRAYLNKLSENFTETVFNPLNEVWEEELKRLFLKFDGDEEGEGS